MRAGHPQPNSQPNAAEPARPPKADRQWWTIFALLFVTVGGIVLFREARREPESPDVIAQPPVSEVELNRRLAERQARIHPATPPTTAPASHHPTTQETIAGQPTP